MTHEYKTGDKTLWEATICSIATNGKIWLTSMADESRGICSIDKEELRPYTPRQEFEYGEEVEVCDNMGAGWLRAFYIGKSPYSKNGHQYIVCTYNSGNLASASGFCYCRKLNTKPRDTITIGNTTYDKSEFENAVKDLKPIKGEV